VERSTARLIVVAGGATIQSHLASARKKAEERVGAHAGDGQVGKLQLRPRIAPGFESHLAADHIAEGGRAGTSFQAREIRD
jgi:hypothetical protein